MSYRQDCVCANCALGRARCWAKAWRRAAKLEYGTTKANMSLIDENAKLRSQLEAAKAWLEAENAHFLTIASPERKAELKLAEDAARERFREAIGEKA